MFKFLHFVWINKVVRVEFGAQANFYLSQLQREKQIIKSLSSHCLWALDVQKTGCSNCITTEVNVCPWVLLFTIKHYTLKMWNKTHPRIIKGLCSWKMFHSEKWDKLKMSGNVHWEYFGIFFWTGNFLFFLLGHFVRNQNKLLVVGSNWLSGFWGGCWGHRHIHRWWQEVLSGMGEWMDYNFLRLIHRAFGCTQHITLRFLITFWMLRPHFEWSCGRSWGYW